MPCCATTTDIDCGLPCQDSPVVSCQHHENNSTVELKETAKRWWMAALNDELFLVAFIFPTFAISMFSWPLVEQRIKSILALESLTLSNYPRAIPNPAQRGVSDAHCGEGSASPTRWSWLPLIRSTSSCYILRWSRGHWRMEWPGCRESRGISIPSLLPFLPFSDLMLHGVRRSDFLFK